MLTKTKPRNDYDELVVLGRHCSDREQRAEAAERDLTKLKLLAYLSTRIGEEMEAVVTGVESYGLFVQGVKLPAEGLVRVESLRDDHYYFDRASHTLGRPSRRQQLSPRRSAARGRRSRRSGTPRDRLPRGGEGERPAGGVHEGHQGHEEGSEGEGKGDRQDTRKAFLKNGTAVIWPAPQNPIHVV